MLKNHIFGSQNDHFGSFLMFLAFFKISFSSLQHPSHRSPLGTVCVFIWINALQATLLVYLNSQLLFKDQLFILIFVNQIFEMYLWTCPILTLAQTVTHSHPIHAAYAPVRTQNTRSMLHDFQVQSLTDGSKTWYGTINVRNLASKFQRWFGPSSVIVRPNYSRRNCL